MSDQLRSVRVKLAYEAARNRPGAPFAQLDFWFNQTRLDLGRINERLEIDDAVKEKLREARLIEAEAFFVKYRDMPDAELSGYAAQLNSPLPAAEDPATTARNVIDRICGLGVRFEVSVRGSLNVSPARLLTDQDKSTITKFKEMIIAEVERRADVWRA